MKTGSIKGRIKSLETILPTPLLIEAVDTRTGQTVRCSADEYISKIPALSFVRVAQGSGMQSLRELVRLNYAEADYTLYGKKGAGHEN